MKTSLLLAAVCFSAKTYAQQQVIDVDKNPMPLSSRVFYTTGGQPFSTSKYVRLTSGSPYFSDSWMKGYLLTKDSVEYSGMLLKLDLLENLLIYLNDKNQEFVSSLPMRIVSLKDTVSNKKYIFTHSSSVPGAPDKEKAWYEILAQGKVFLYKQYAKSIYESKAYASSITEQSVITDEKYFIGTGTQLIRVKKIKDIPSVLSDKKKELEMFINQNRLSGKTSNDYVLLIAYYNSL
ncbi:MAG: hypothetical protein E6Q24_10080 [Chitinophagaceae bacterium]|jgi:hypothetical protein|nr:MAG: hypothetical protein E6Q24_10080 [Chitinophagaceae bacterium]